jgi:predicted nucleic acid-binding protein
VVAFLLDASVALAWVLPERDSARCAPLFPIAAAEGVAVPALWPAEVGNVLLVNERRGRITAAEHQLALQRLAAVPVELEPASWPGQPALPLARRHALSLYDALYLDLALRRALPLATLDGALRRAAEAEGVPLLP